MKTVSELNEFLIGKHHVIGYFDTVTVLDMHTWPHIYSAVYLTVHVCRTYNIIAFNNICVKMISD